MRPIYIVVNEVDGCWRYAEYFGEMFRGQPETTTSERVAVAYNSHLKRIQFSCSTLLASMIRSVAEFILPVVLGLRTPRQVIQGMIRPTGWAVARLHPSGRWTKKGFKNESMHIDVVYLPIAVKVDMGSRSIPIRLQLVERPVGSSPSPYATPRPNPTVLRSVISGEVFNRFHHRLSNKSACFIGLCVRHPGGRNPKSTGKERERNNDERTNKYNLFDGQMQTSLSPTR